MKRFLTVALAATALAALPLAAASADSHEAEVVVVHGVPELEVDVWVDDTRAIEGFSFGEVTVTSLPAGDYTLAVSAAGDDEPVLTLDASLQGGTSVTVAAFLDADGNPTMEAFANETDGTGIQPFHLAAFGPVAIVAGGEALIDDVPNGVTARIDVPGGTTVEGVGIAAAGSTDLAIELGDVTVPEDTLLLAYAIGPDAGEELPTVVVQDVAAASADSADSDDDADDSSEGDAPTAVHSGTGGFAAETGMPALVIGLMMLGALALAAPAVASARRRR